MKNSFLTHYLFSTIITPEMAYIAIVRMVHLKPEVPALHQGIYTITPSADRARGGSNGKARCTCVCRDCARVQDRECITIYYSGATIIHFRITTTTLSPITIRILATGHGLLGHKASTTLHISFIEQQRKV